MIIGLAFFSCSTMPQRADDIDVSCNIVEESFQFTSMRKYLSTTTNNRELINKFIDDSSTYSILTVEGKNVLYATLSNDYWIVYYNEKKSIVSNKKLIADFRFYSDKNIVYKVDCPNDYVVYDSNEPFKAIWLKESRQVKFLYYSTKCEIDCLKNDDYKKIDLLNNIIRQLKINF